MSDFKTNRDCPACHAELKLETDPRMRTGFALVCDNPDCPDGGGAWCAQEFIIIKWREHEQRAAAGE